MPVLTSRPTGIFRITALKASVGQGNMKYCRVRLSLKVSHADAGSGRSGIKESKKATKGIKHFLKRLCVKRGSCATAVQCHNAVKIPAWFHNRTGDKSQIYGDVRPLPR